MVQIPITQTHNTPMGYILWVFGFAGLHRFYYGKPITGLIWALTGGLFLIGWIVDLFLIPAMEVEASTKFTEGQYNYTISWTLLILGGIFGIHRMYLQDWVIGLLYLVTGGLFGLGVLYDLFTLNTQITDKNLKVFRS